MTSLADVKQTLAQENSGVRVRLAWGGGIAQKWQGEIKVDGATLVNPQVLALTADAPSTVLPNDNGLDIRHQIETRYGGVDVSIQSAKPDAQITVSLRDPTSDARFLSLIHI